MGSHPLHLMLHLKKNAFTPDNEPKNRHFYYLQHEELAHAMGLEDGPLPVIIDALGDDTL